MEEHTNQKMMSALYVPTINVVQITAKHTLGKIGVAYAGTPEQTCGTAHRIGYTGKAANDLAIYRLKVRIEVHSDTVTLPQLFVVDKGSFIEYEEWLCNRNNLI